MTVSGDAGILFAGRALRRAARPADERLPAGGDVDAERVRPVGSRRRVARMAPDARIVHQPRSAGYQIDPLRILLPELRSGLRWDTVESAPAAREAGIAARSRALLDASAAILALLAPAAPAPPARAHG
ncbi:hypothetical protein ACIQU4_08845 [Streptomyces sp. NPDC090741]|uniref:hypothetical protein n=1 Tax=Streptomyces sp. NPDC090741 TaxID=3365967 RepID=UPI0038146EA6